MKVREGFAYHISDEYFDLAQSYGVKNKTDSGNTFPSYCCSKDSDNGLYWMVPMSTKIGKYGAIIEKETQKYGRCFSVVVGSYDMKEVAFQVQGMFPVKKRHVLHEHTRKGKVVSVSPETRTEIRRCFDKTIELSKKGIICTMTDIASLTQFYSHNSYDGDVTDHVNDY